MYVLTSDPPWLCDEILLLLVALELKVSFRIMQKKGSHFVHFLAATSTRNKGENNFRKKKKMYGMENLTHLIYFS